MRRWDPASTFSRVDPRDLIDFSPYEPFEDLAESVRELESASRGRGLGAFRTIPIPRKTPPKRRRSSA